MRKVLFFVFLAVSFFVGSSALCHAQFWNIKVTDGSMPKFKDGQTVMITTNFSRTTWDEKKLMKKFWAEEYEDCYEDGELDTAYNEFLTTLHDEAVAAFRRGHSSLTVSNDNPEYTLAITITNFHDSRDMWRRKAIGFGRADVIDNTTGETVCTLEFKNVKGGDGTDEATAAAKCMKEIGGMLSSKCR
jgi:hypothetical protein